MTVYGEYVAALDNFEPGEFYNAADRESRKPAAWNVELGYAFTDSWQVALRYGGSSDGDAGSGRRQCGAIVHWGLFKNTHLGLEYLHSEFENDNQDIEALTAQLAIEF